MVHLFKGEAIVRCQAQGYQCVLFTIFFLTSFCANLFSTSTSNLILLDRLVFFVFIRVILFEYKLKAIVKKHSCGLLCH